ncbi:MAG: type II toxin-antitoxin system VapC family toxin [Anaerolineae bacterium]|nr:type II toxin-antitoxin system VapC family toxin [Anaerolineae bacterium]MBL8105460.1 type II toxin-antitoxin system VapC family toxin [Anaerolineales bacterium]MCC7187886.1 type II toxin-antitoxin system VapC family toxin [Anaerolineales bacterium]
MKLLFDTHTFLWWNTEDPRLSARAADLIADGKNEIFLSVASVWEISIKAAKGKLVLPEPPEQYISNRMNLYQIQSLPVLIRHAVKVYELPAHHRDPFDRLLIAQSQAESMPLISVDSDIQKYDVEVVW